MVDVGTGLVVLSVGQNRGFLQVELLPHIDGYPKSDLSFFN